jgi:phage shock protein E
MHISTFLRRLTAVAAVASAALLLTACGGPGAIQTVDAASFAKQAQTPGVTVIDVRTPAEFAAGHIAGAINIDVEGSDFNSGIASLDMTKTYAVYCHSGRRSLIAANAMADAGFTSIYNLDGGIGAWSAAGNQLVTS